MAKNNSVNTSPSSEELKILLLTLVTKLNVLTAMTSPEEKNKENFPNREMSIHKMSMELYAMVDEATIKWVHPMLYYPEDSE